jgi:hypothetical protein
MGYGPKQKQARLYRGQIPSPGRPTVAWREDRVRFWAAIARGAKTEDACVEAGVSAPVGFRWFRHAGGVNPGLPPTVSGRYLSFAEREEIALLRAQNHGVREIARRLNRAPSTISRELRRNASTRTYHLEYKASIAQWHAERRARRPKVAKLVSNHLLREYVQDRLSGAVCDADGRPLGPAGQSGTARTSRIEVIAAGCRVGVRSRSRTDCRSISLMIGPCGSATRRSTRLFSLKAAVPSCGNWFTVFAQAGRYAFVARDRGSKPGLMSRRRS